MLKQGEHAHPGVNGSMLFPEGPDNQCLFARLVPKLVEGMAL